MRLNLGCGDEYLEGYVNVDLRPTGDVIADVRCLPFGTRCADEVRASDVLEHFPAVETEPLLAEWQRVCKIGGWLKLRVPNLQWLGAAIALDDGMVGAYIQNVYGGHRWGPAGAWDTHHTGWTPRTLRLMLERFGFLVTANDLAPNMNVEAVLAI